MDTDLEVLSQAVKWFEEDSLDNLYYATLIEAWGSSPRPIGSTLVIHPDGLFSGSLSNGCIETEIVSRLTLDKKYKKFPCIIEIGINNTEAQSLGLSCGGRIKICIEKIHSPTDFHEIIKTIKVRKQVQRRTCLRTGETSLQTPKTQKQLVADKNTLSKIFGPNWQLLIIGAGQLSSHLAQLAYQLDYQVTICENRPLILKNWQEETAKLFTGMPDDAVEQYGSDGRSAIVTLSHLANMDDLALMDALECPAFYVGALGSKKNSNERRNRLKSLGLSAFSIEKLHAPVGLNIGSHTPPEIALSIMAEITAIRNSLS